LPSRLLSKNLKIKIFKTIILSVVLYGCEAWSLTLREEYRLRVFENRILRRIFEPTISNFIVLSFTNTVRVIKSRRLRWGGHIARIEVRNAFKILTGIPAGKIPLGRPRLRWEDNIKKDIKEIGVNTRNWVDLSQDRNYWRALVNAALNLRVP